MYAVRPLRLELTALRVRASSVGTKRRFLGAQELKVNIGAGDLGRDGWVNLDIRPRKGVTVVYDARRRLPFPDGSVTLMFSEHFVEHLDYQDDVPQFLAECHRVMCDGGTLRFVMPDMGKYIAGYVADGWDLMERVRNMGADHVDPYFGPRHGVRYRTKGELLNYVARQESREPHLYFYDAETLTTILRVAGFRTAEERQYGDSAVEGLALDLPQRASESLYVEAVK